jgi:hypothetical protein
MQKTESGPSFISRLIAVVVLAVAAWLLFKFVIGIVAGLATLLAVIVAVIAVVWALRVLL